MVIPESNGGMTPYEFIQKAIQEKWDKDHTRVSWLYCGPGYGQRAVHQIGILDPHEVVTCSMTHGWLGSPEEFVVQFKQAA